MEFLVEVETRWPIDGDPHRKAELVAAESARAGALAAQGALKRLWRVPGTWKNVGLWQATDATELHQILSSLPFFPWMTIEVRAMATHPNDPINL
ncbi:muconolactone Delta-isomerase [Devosia alba]|uniref:muconolactone Delta-isomerase n=1 Tax=Devosia alba TaxID=3152360 RepID=UPI003264DFFD